MDMNLTTGPIVKKLLTFTAPLLLGNLLQQLYNIVDTLIVGRFIGVQALAAVGSCYALMVFLTSILLGFCMGSGNVFAIHYGAKDSVRLRTSLVHAFFLILLMTLLLMTLTLSLKTVIIRFLQTPEELVTLTDQYLSIIFWGMGFTFLYNFFAALLRSLGNSTAPLWFLLLSTVLNIILDLWFILGFSMGVQGAALATILSQSVSALGVFLYAYHKLPDLRPKATDFRFQRDVFQEIVSLSSLTSLQQSIMNFGILMIQGLVNSFGTQVMAAFAAGVKIDSFAYMPVQDFGNAFSTFISQNYGAKKPERIQRGIHAAFRTSSLFSLLLSLLIWLFAKPLLTLFISPAETEILSIGVNYLRIEGAFYIGIGFLFLFYGYFRAVKRPLVSVILTIISLGTRVLLAYTLSSIPTINVYGIWWAIPIGWVLADIAGFIFYKFYKNNWYERNCMTLAR